MTKPRVFLSYSHCDVRELQKLLPYLATLTREGLVDVWVDKDLRGGDRWHDEIEEALGAATMAVLLISQNFIISKFIYEEELPRILARQIEGQLAVLPVFLSPSTVTSDTIDFRDGAGVPQRIKLSEFQGFGTPSKTLKELRTSERERTFVELHNRIKELASEVSHIGEPDRRSPSGGPAEPTQPGLSKAQRPRIRRIPYPRNHNFTGRENYLELLHKGLKSGKPAAVTQAVAGLGGIGKTQLALEYSYRYGGEYDVVWWIRSERRETCLNDLEVLGKALGAVAPGMDPSDGLVATLDWLDGHQDWLLVFDNAESPDHIRDFLPKARGGSIIITSRYAAWGAVAQTLTVELWRSEEAVRFLSQRTRQTDHTSALAISEALGYLPLALAQVAAYVDEVGCDLEHYLELLKAHPTAALQLRPNSSEAEKAIATVWEIAFGKLANANPQAIALLNLFAFLAPDRISLRMLSEHGDRLPPPLDYTVKEPFALDAAVAALRSYSLINATEDGLSVHRLVQAVVRSRLDDNGYRLFSEAAKEFEGSPPLAVLGEQRIPRKPRVWFRSLRAAQVFGALGVAVALAMIYVKPVKKIDGSISVKPVKKIDSGVNAPWVREALEPRAGRSAPLAHAKPLRGSFDGIPATNAEPPDTVGAVGPKHYVQMVNSAFAIFDKSGNILSGPTPISRLWKGTGGACGTDEGGDPIVRYDHLADRWLLTHSAYLGHQECIAVSRGPDPVNDGWYLYALEVPVSDSDSAQPIISDTKIAQWPDGYYTGSVAVGKGGYIAVFDREAMLQGRPARQQHFYVSGDPQLLLPSDLDGPPPPLGTPNFFVRVVNGSLSGGEDRLEIFALHVDWSNPKQSTFTQVGSVATRPFNSVLCSSSNGDCVPQPRTAVRLAGLTDRLMWRVQYRNFGTHETLLANHTVNVDGRGLAGIRWYELRRFEGGKWSIFQQGTYSPDSVHRWLGSIAMDTSGNIALGYSVSSTTEYPGIRYTSRLQSDPLGQMPRGEGTQKSGTGAQTDSRWGDYSSMEVDPSTPCTFWYATQYQATSGAFNWKTLISVVHMTSCNTSN